MSGFINERLHCWNQLTVTVSRNTYEHTPIFWNWVGLSRLVYDLIEVECKGVVVLATRRHYLVKHLFALKQDSTTQSGADIYDSLHTLALCVQAKHTLLCVRHFVNVVV